MAVVVLVVITVVVVVVLVLVLVLVLVVVVVVVEVKNLYLESDLLKWGAVEVINEFKANRKYETFVQHQDFEIKKAEKIALAAARKAKRIAKAKLATQSNEEAEPAVEQAATANLATPAMESNEESEPESASFDASRAKQIASNNDFMKSLGLAKKPAIPREKKSKPPTPVNSAPIRQSQRLRGLPQASMQDESDSQQQDEEQSEFESEHCEATSGVDSD
jgi:hypothetical protein